jgi:hypothetical protein
LWPVATWCGTNGSKLFLAYNYFWGDRLIATLYIAQDWRIRHTANNLIRMKLVQEQFDRVLAMVLMASLVACGPSEQPVQEATDAAQATEQAASTGEMTVSEPAPAEPDRFANMFVSEISHEFNPGLQIGETFPAIRALHQGEEILTIDSFIRDRGAIFIAARSVDW